jgi:hypothetical protein
VSIANLGAIARREAWRKGEFGWFRARDAGEDESAELARPPDEPAAPVVATTRLADRGDRFIASSAINRFRRSMCESAGPRGGRAYATQQRGSTGRGVIKPNSRPAPVVFHL